MQAGSTIRPIAVDVLGVPVHCLDVDSAVTTVATLLDRSLDHSRPATIFAVNPEKIMSCRNRPELLEALRSADLLIPDGIGVVLAVRLLHRQQIERVPGSDLMPMICAEAANRGLSIFLLGGAPGIAQRAAAVLASVYPTIKIAGREHGYFKEADTERLIESINRTKADI